MKEVKPSWLAAQVNSADGSYVWRGRDLPFILAVDNRGRVFEGVGFDKWSVVRTDGVPPPFWPHKPNYASMDLKVDE